MTNYEAPTINGHRALEGALAQNGSHFGGSDAEIKHNVEPVRSTDYQAPAISSERQLDGRLGFDSVREF